MDFFFFGGLKLWNFAVEFSTVSGNGTRSVAVMCFSELQVSTSSVLNNNWVVDILLINIVFEAIKSNGEFTEQVSSSRYLLNASRTFAPVTTNVRHFWRDLTSERLTRDALRPVMNASTFHKTVLPLLPANLRFDILTISVSLHVLNCLC